MLFSASPDGKGGWHWAFEQRSDTEPSREDRWGPGSRGCGRTRLVRAGEVVLHRTVGLLTLRSLSLGRSPRQRRAGFEETCACGFCLMNPSKIHRILKKLLKELHWQKCCQFGLKGTGSVK